MKFKNIDKKYILKSVLLRTIFVLIDALFLALVIFAAPKDAPGLWLTLVLFAGLILLLAIVYAYVMPKLQYKNYLYLVKEDEIILMFGVIFKKSVVIPVVQMQDIGYNEGPISQIFKLADVTISTAGSNHFIVCLPKNDAKEIVEQVKEKIKLYKTNGGK